MDRNPATDRLRSEAWDKALYAYGTSYIFEKRAHKYRIGLRVISFLGIAVPLCIGAIIMSFNVKPEIMKFILVVASIMGVCQLVASLWSVVARWEERYTSSITSLKKNTFLKNKWERFAKNSGDISKSDYDILLKSDEEQESTDLESGITDNEKRMGMRAALFYYKRPCATCNTKPVDMKPSTCDTCGNF